MHGENGAYVWERVHECVSVRVQGKLTTGCGCNENVCGERVSVRCECVSV